MRSLAAVLLSVAVLGLAVTAAGARTTVPAWPKAASASAPEAGHPGLLLLSSAPGNDMFAAATRISGASGSTTGTTSFATTESGEPTITGSADATHSVWYVWTAPSSGVVSFETTGSQAGDTILGIFTGNALPSLKLVGADDDRNGYDVSSLASARVTAGATYHVSVNNYWGGTSPLFTLKWRYGTPPSNDDFGSATELLGGVGKTDAVDTSFATAQPGEPSHPWSYLTQMSSVWYSFTPHADATLTVSVDTSPWYGVSVALCKGSSVGSLQGVAYGGPGLAAHVTSGTPYHLSVGGNRGDRGILRLNWRLTTPFRFQRRIDTTGSANGFGYDRNTGNIAIADTFGQQIAVYGPTGSLVTTWGGYDASGTVDGKFQTLFDCDVDSHGNVVTVEMTGTRIQKFSPSGSVLATWTCPVPPAGGSISVDYDDNIWVSRFAPGGLAYEFSPGGSLLATVGSGTPSSPSYLSQPQGIANDPRGDTWIAQPSRLAPNGSSWITHFGPDGSFVSTFSASTTATAFVDRRLARDLGSSLFVVSRDKGQLLQYDATTMALIQSWGSVGSSDTSMTSPQGVRATEDRRLLSLADTNGRLSIWFSPTPTTARQIAGGSRYDTAVEASKFAYPNGLQSRDAEGYKTVVVATGQDFPDALSGAALAGAANGPLLLTRSSTLPASVADEIQRLHVTRVVILGGNGAVSPAVEAELYAAAPQATIIRIAGATRAETAEAVAARVRVLLGNRYGHEAFLATARDFPDALAAAPIAAARGIPIFLYDPRDTQWLQRLALGHVTDVRILGGTGAVPAGAETALKNRFGASHVKRLAGADRSATSVEIAKFGVGQEDLRYGRLGVATSMDFPDALAAGPMTGRDRGVMLLVNGSSTTLATSIDNLLKTQRNKFYDVRFMGGTGALGQAVRKAMMRDLW